MTARRVRLWGGLAILVVCFSAALGRAATDPDSAPGNSPSAPDAIMDEGSGLHSVHLNANGTLSVHVNSFDASGVPRLSQAHLSFVQDHHIVATANVDATGQVQVGGLQPGVYTVLAQGPDGVGMLAVRIQPFGLATSATEASFDITLAPSADASLLSSMGTDAPGGPAAAGNTFTDNPPTAMGGGGGADALGGLLGVGLGGLGIGLSGFGGGGGGGGGTASQFAPAVVPSNGTGP